MSDSNVMSVGHCVRAALSTSPRRPTAHGWTRRRIVCCAYAENRPRFSA